MDSGLILAFASISHKTVCRVSETKDSLFYESQFPAEILPICVQFPKNHSHVHAWKQYLDSIFRSQYVRVSASIHSAASQSVVALKVSL